MVECCSKMNIISRSNVLLANISLGITKNDDDKIPMGELLFINVNKAKKKYMLFIKYGISLSQLKVELFFGKIKMKFFV